MGARGLERPVFVIDDIILNDVVTPRAVTIPGVVPQQISSSASASTTTRLSAYTNHASVSRVTTAQHHVPPQNSASATPSVRTNNVSAPRTTRIPHHMPRPNRPSETPSFYANDAIALEASNPGQDPPPNLPSTTPSVHSNNASAPRQPTLPHHIPLQDLTATRSYENINNLSAPRETSTPRHIPPLNFKGVYFDVGKWIPAIQIRRLNPNIPPILVYTKDFIKPLVERKRPGVADLGLELFMQTIEREAGFRPGKDKLYYYKSPREVMRNGGPVRLPLKTGHSHFIEEAMWIAYISSDMVGDDRPQQPEFVIVGEEEDAGDDDQTPRRPRRGFHTVVKREPTDV